MRPTWLGPGGPDESPEVGGGEQLQCHRRQVYDLGHHSKSNGELAVSSEQ